MIPAMTAMAQTPARSVRRLGFVYMPMGCDQARWTPEGTGTLAKLSPILTPLEPVKDQITVITNLELQSAYPGTHDTANAGFLSAAYAKHTEGSDYYLGTTVDQLAAKQIGQDTQLPSLELCMDLDPLPACATTVRLCLHELPFLVVANDATALRSASAQRVRASVRRRRKPRGAAGGARAPGQPA